jgi:hypothetical protein
MILESGSVAQGAIRAFLGLFVSLVERRYDENFAWRRAFVELKRIGSLPYDWDDMEASAPDFGAIRLAEFVLGTLFKEACPSPDRVVASPMGSVLVQWFCDSLESRVELEFLRRSEYRWVVFRDGRVSQHNSVKISEPLLNLLLPDRSDEADGALSAAGLVVRGPTRTEDVTAFAGDWAEA